VYGDGVWWKKFNGDGEGMGLIFTTASLFSSHYKQSAMIKQQYRVNSFAIHDS